MSDDEDKVRDLLGQAFEVDPPSSARPTSDGVRAAHRRRRMVGSAGSAGLVTVVVLAAIVLPSLGKGSPSAVPAGTNRSALASHASLVAPKPISGPDGTSSAPSADAGLQLLSDGDTVAAAGRVVSVPGKPVRLCGPEEFDAVAWASGHEPAPVWCPLGVDVTGVDLAKLSNVRTKAAAVEGFAYLRGTYRGTSVQVSLQTSPLSDGTIDAVESAPCAEPAGGWDHLGAGGNPDDAMSRLQALMSPDHNVVTTAIFRPTPTSSVIVVAADHPDVLRSALAAHARSYCIVQSRYTYAQVTQAKVPWEADLRDHVGKAGGIVANEGESVSEDGQATLLVTVITVTPKVQAWLAAAPAGLVQVTSWLQPVAADAPLPSLPAQPTSTPTPFVTDTSTFAPSTVATTGPAAVTTPECAKDALTAHAGSLGAFAQQQWQRITVMNSGPSCTLPQVTSLVGTSQVGSMPVAAKQATPDSGFPAVVPAGDRVDLVVIMPDCQQRQDPTKLLTSLSLTMSSGEVLQVSGLKVDTACGIQLVYRPVDG